MLYDPAPDNATLIEDAVIPDFSTGTDAVVDFSLIRPSGKGVELGFMSVNEKGQVGIGSTYQKDETTFTRLLEVYDPLTISFSGESNSGTIALKEQQTKPLFRNHFGKLYVKPRAVGDQTQALFFLDDGDNEYTLSNSKFDSFDGLLYGDQYGNTYGGWYSPRTRVEDADRVWNTLLGFGAGWSLNDTLSTTDRDCNTMVGALVGSGMTMGSHNTVMGCKSFTHSNRSSSNIVIGHKNITKTDLSDTDKDSVHNSIIIGTGLYIDETPSDYTLAIGYGDTPLILGSLAGSRKFGIQSPVDQRTYLTVNAQEHEFKISHNTTRDIENAFRNSTELDLTDKVNSDSARGMMHIGFSNAVDGYQRVVEVDPSGRLPTTAPAFDSPNPKVPHVGISGDLRVLGAIRFSDGSTIDSSQSTVYLASSGVARSLIDSNFHFHLDYRTLADAAGTIDTNDSYVSTHVNASEGMAGISRMTIAQLSQYVSSGYATMSTNCNAFFTQAENTIDLTKNEKTIFIGCDVATGATGWKHSIFMGTNAGYGATNSLGLTSDGAATFIGYQAGYLANNTENSIFIGSAAGKNAISSKKSIFIGQGAGERTTNYDSIGIGAHALEGNTDTSDTETGYNNIEIIAGKDNHQRLMYEQGDSANKINIQNIIAGNTLQRYLSIGDARLAPTAPLEVRRDSTGDNGHTGDDIQAWHNEDSKIGRVTVSGDFVSNIASSGYLGNMPSESWFGNIEGFMDEYIYAPADFNHPSSGTMTIRNSTFGNAEKIWLINRDTKLSIHGPGAVGGTAYVIATRVNEEWRPIYVSCSG